MAFHPKKIQKLSISRFMTLLYDILTEILSNFLSLSLRLKAKYRECSSQVNKQMRRRRKEQGTYILFTKYERVSAPG